MTVSAVIMRNRGGQVLTVRKRGTQAFMLPGGKLEPGENPLNAALREVDEELGLAVAPADLDYLGTVYTQAANEADTRLRAALFILREPIESVDLAAELEEFRWVSPDAVDAHQDQAPLNVEHVFPLLDRLDRGGHIALRRFTLDDIDAHLAGEDPESIKWLTSGLASTFQSTRDWIAAQQLAFDLHRDELVFTVRVGGQLAGMVTVNQTPKGPVFQPGEVNISYAIYPQFRRRGVGARAVELILEFAETLDRFDAAILRVNADNVASVALAASVPGAEFDGDFLESDRFDGDHAVAERVTMRHFRVPLRQNALAEKGTGRE